MVNLVSIITPSYNSSKYISQTIESVLNQTYQNWEMIIVDDCSKDNTVKIIEGYTQKDFRIKLYKLENNSGAAVARNKAIDLSNGRFIAFLDSDDLWLPLKLEKQVNFMLNNNAVLSYTAYKKIDSFGNIGNNIVNVPDFITYNSMLNTCSIGCLTAMYDTKQIGKHYMPEINIRQDYGLWLKIIKKVGQEDYSLWLKLLKNFSKDNKMSNHKFLGLNENLALYRIHNESISNNKLKAALFQWIVYRKIEKLSLFKSLYHFINYAYHGYKKHRKF